MDEHLTRVELFGVIPVMPFSNTEYQKDTILLITLHKDINKRTFILKCAETGKILIKFDTDDKRTLLIPADETEDKPT